MDYSSDSKNVYNMDNGLNLRGTASAPAPGQFTGQAISNPFGTAQQSRLTGVLDLQYQQRRQNSSSFDAGSYNPSTQPAGQTTYGLQAGTSPGLVADSAYGSLQMGSYDSSGIVDWNSGSSRGLGGMDNSYSLSQSNAGLFPASASSSDWSTGLRTTDILGMQHPSGYGMGDLQSNGLGMPQQSNYSHQRSSNGRYQQGTIIATPSSRNYMPNQSFSNPGTGGSNAQGRALNKMLLDILRERTVDPNRLAMAIDANIERMDCVNLATLLFHTGKKRLLLTPAFIKRIAIRFSTLKEELRAREASNALYGLKCMSSECPEVRQLVFALASKVAVSMTELVAQAVGNALYGCQMMTSDHEEVRYLLQVLSVKVSQCTELLEAQNIGNALYGLRGMNSDCKEVRMLIAALTPKIATAREELNGQALGNSLYGLQGMNSREQEVRTLLNVLATKVSRTWEDLKAQEVGNALYGLKRMNSDVLEVRQLIESLVPKVASSPEILDAQAIGNSFYGMQNMKSDNEPVLHLLATMADKVLLSPAELDGQAMGNSLYGLQGMNSDQAEVRAVVHALTMKIQASCLEMNAQELGNSLYGLQRMSSEYPEIRRLLVALTQKVGSSKHELTSQEIGNALFGLQGMRSELRETRLLVRQMTQKIQQSTSLIDPQGIANSLFGLQRMTSDSEEVRMLLQVLAMKIEQSWKLLSAQHISNSLFGLQGLSSIDVEVRAVIHALVPKVLASRDEMTPKQICNCFYGLKNCSSAFDEVRSMLGPLTEKLNLCSELIPLQSLAVAFYGLQGMDSECEEVRALLISLCEKLATVDEIDAHSIGNIFFGLQRMSTVHSEVQTAVELLSPMVTTLAESGLEIGTSVCSNILYGLQNCSCSDEYTRNILVVVISRIKEFISGYSQSIVPGGDSSSEISFPEAVRVHQALCLALQAFPDLHLDAELNDNLRGLQQELHTIVTSRKGEQFPRQLSSLERRLADSIADTLVEEPFVVSTCELLHGFDSLITIRLRSGISLQTEDGSDWAPVLNIEVGGGSDGCPCKELYNRLRASYLGQEQGVAVQIIPQSAIIGKSRGALRECLRRSSDLFAALYPPTPQDASKFALVLSGLGLCRPDDILASLRADDSRSAEGQLGDMGASFFSLGSGDVMIGGMEDFTDGLDDGLDYFDARLPIQQRGLRRSLGIPMGWIGDLPVVNVSLSTPCSSPTTQFLSPHPLAMAQRRPPATYSMVGASPMPQGSRVVCPPFIQVGPPPVPAPAPAPIASSFSNGIASRLSQQPFKPQTFSSTSPALLSRPAHEVSLDPVSLPAASRPSVPGQMKFDGSAGPQSPGRSSDDNANFSVSGDGVSAEGVGEEEGSEVDSEIALLEAQLEIKRLEARLLMLKKSKSKAV